MTGRQGGAGARILGLGGYRPARTVPNEELCARLDSSDTWIRRRSGIVSRRYAGPDETVITMAAHAGGKALADAGVAPADVDTVLLASMSYLYQSPAAAPQVAAALGARSAAAFDVQVACAGFCYALAVADGLIRAGTSRRVLVIGSERMTDIVDPDDRGAAFLFADGAGAVLVGPAAEPGIHSVAWGSDGEQHGLIAHQEPWTAARDADHPGPYMRMAGSEVFRWAIREVPRTAATALERAGVTVDQLSAFVPHQANLRITEAVAKALDLPPHVVVADDITSAGNTSAASVPLAMEALRDRGALPSGGLALLAGFGAGLAHAALVVTLP
ncbi:ketoacyl-ACP synthase III [Streptomyces sp. 110]|uniref:Beta-ketoacyl-[acyl-carrier-protein] synthase III n=1 Tax=Streptomyces endocoffeicus TaxID=2898945 RepID=A0ABS1PT96_9ACTN|nr:beta-ketoacyl-ACP synthase III [Streptomyces endocoffeicus]MBL1114926.1 ketoacyl-ACP synthase III [Streptomyces endocoffeicus]